MISSMHLKRLVISLLLIPQLAMGQDLKLIPDLQLRTKFSPQAVAVSNQQGVWFPNDDAEYLLKLRTDLIPSLYNTAKTQEAMLNEYRNRSKLTDDMLSLELQRSTETEKANRSCNAALQKCLGDKSWYESTTFHIVAGFVGGVLFTGGIVWVARK